MSKSLLPLSMLNIGEKAELVEFQDGNIMKQRLASMGLNPGMKVTMIKNNMGGPIILGVMDTRIALGRGMAQRIIVLKE